MMLLLFIPGRSRQISYVVKTSGQAARFAENLRVLFLQQMCAELFAAFLTQICRRHIEHGLTAAHALIVHPLCSSCIGNDHTGGELRVGIQLQAVLDHMLMLFVFTGPSGTEYKSAVRHTCMIAEKFFL